ncbi:MAG TPA: alpha/beta hydrolase [Thermoanaerobaculia bacterium]|nr:alpha/beta hydrolase [Thermoanaerobaculia bacterium]
MRELGAVVSRGVLVAALLMADPCPWREARGQTGAVAAVRAAPGGFVQVGNAKLYYEECGKAAPTVVLLHDGGANSGVWDDVWPELCRHFHTIRYDRRGFGRSPPATSWYYETDDLAALLHQLAVSRAVLVGSSHGGEVSINFTLAHPEIVQQLVLVGAVVSGMPYSQHFLERGKHAIELQAKGDIKGAIAEWSRDRYLIGPDHEAARKRLSDILSANPQDLTHPDRPLRDQPALPRLHEIHVPTLLLTGDADIPDVHAQAGAIEAGIPGARRMVIEGVGHLMYLEIPAEFSRRVIGFIELNGH